MTADNYITLITLYEAQASSILLLYIYLNTTIMELELNKNEGSLRLSERLISQLPESTQQGLNIIVQKIVDAKKKAKPKVHTLNRGRPPCS